MQRRQTQPIPQTPQPHDPTPTDARLTSNKNPHEPQGGGALKLPLEQIELAWGLVLGLWLMLGLVVGSAMNAIIHRLPLMLKAEAATTEDSLGAEDPTSEPQHPRQTLSLWWPRSHCPHCLHPLGVMQLIPVLSFLHLGGRCHFCQAPIAKRYVWVEVLNAAWWCWCAWRFSQPLGLWSLSPMLSAGNASVLLQMLACALWSLMGSVLIALAFIDWEHQLLPDALTQPLLWGGLMASGSGLLGIELHASLWGAVLGYGCFAGIALVYQALTHQEGLGQGDFKLLAALGAWLGPLSLVPIVFIASCAGLCLGLWRVRRHGMTELQRPMPFGPFLVLGALITVMWGPNNWLGLL